MHAHTNRCSEIEHSQSDELVAKAASQATDLMLAEFVLVLIVQSLGYCHRIAPLMSEKPWRSRVWIACACTAALLQVLEQLETLSL
jgi:hypothetical protein